MNEPIKKLNIYLMSNVTDFTGMMQHAEVIYFKRPEEGKYTEYVLSQFRIQTLDITIVDLAGSLFCK